MAGTSQPQSSNEVSSSHIAYHILVVHGQSIDFICPRVLDFGYCHHLLVPLFCHLLIAVACYFSSLIDLGSRSGGFE